MAPVRYSASTGGRSPRTTAACTSSSSSSTPASSTGVPISVRMAPALRRSSSSSAGSDAMNSKYAWKPLRTSERSESPSQRASRTAARSGTTRSSTRARNTVSLSGK